MTTSAPTMAAALALLALLAAPVQAHGTEVTGSILVPFPDFVETSAFAILRSVSNTNLPNGVVTWTVGATAGNSFVLETLTTGADFDVEFTGGAYVNGIGNEGGTVPGTGQAVIHLFLGNPGSTFKWHEF